MKVDQHRLCIELQRLDWARQINDCILQKGFVAPWLLRRLPGGGGYTYLLYNYRWNRFGPMLRKLPG